MARDKTETYILATGASAASTLEKQHQLLSSLSFAQLQKAGLKEGMHVWDVGCGSGTMTEYLAHSVGPSGHIYALDINAEQLSVTRERIVIAGLTNVTCILADITMPFSELLKQSESADIVYSRLVLMHLQNPEAAIKHMYALLKPGGTLSLQESTMSTLRISPKSQTFQDYTQTLVSLGAHKGVDYDIGRKLPALCSKVGFFSRLTQYTSQSTLSARAAKETIILRISEWKDKALSAGIATRTQFDMWEEEINKFPEDDPSFSFFCAEQTHIVGSKLPNKKEDTYCGFKPGFLIGKSF